MLMIGVNVPIQISRGIFVCGEIIQSYHEGDYTIIKLPRNGNSKAKRLTFIKWIVFCCQVQLMGWMQLRFLYRSSIGRLMQNYTRRRTFSTFFKKDRIWIWPLSILRMPLHIQTCRAKKAKSLRMARSEITGYSFLDLIQNDKRCFENSSCKLMSNSENSFKAWKAFRHLKFQFCMVCGSNFSWIKVLSASETVYQAFNFSQKLCSVLSKQRA